MSDENSKVNPEFEGTMVDLGEDLLESTRAPLREPVPEKAAPEAVSSTAPQDQAQDQEEDDLQKGEILMNERLFEDAKKVFRRLLRKDSYNEAARKYLEEIQKQEIQDLLGSEPSRKRLGPRATTEEEDTDGVLRRLEKDLHISFEKAELHPVPDLFKDEAAFVRYRERLMEAVIALAPKDRLDIGIAHLEMGLFEVAQSVFESVVRYEEHKVVGMYLLGLSLIYGGKGIEATIRLEPLARDLTLSESQKTDFLYLMGLAFEKLNDTKKAREFYRRVHHLNPKYRDVVEKLK